MDRLMNTKIGAHGMMLFWVLLVGSSFPLAATFDDALSPLWLTVVRFFMAAALMLPWVLRTPGWLPRNIKALLGYGMMGALLAIFFSAQFLALNLTSTLSVAALFVTLPAIAWLLGRLAGVERSGFGRLGVLMLGAAGALGVVLRGGSNGLAGFGAGEWLFLAGCACLAAYSVSSRLLVTKAWLPENPLLATFWSLLIGAGLMVPAALVEQPDGGAGFWQLLDLQDLLVLALLALFASVLSFWILQRALLVLMPSSVSAYSYLTPLVSLVLALQAGTAHLDPMLGISLVLLIVTLIWLIGSERGGAEQARACPAE